MTILAFVGAISCALTAVVFIATTITSRRYGPVEAEMAFEALRVRTGHALYFDPLVGAHEYGEPPTRYFVLYTPIWPMILAWLGPASLEGLRSGGRIVNSLAWFGFFVWTAWSTPKERRTATFVAASLSAGVFFLAREASVAGPDTVACVLAGIALFRAARKGEMDSLSAALLALGPFVKPSAIGCAVGVCIAHVLVKRVAAWRSLAVFAAVALAAAGACVVSSHGMWPLHMFRATGQTLSFDRLVSEVSGRVLFLGLPHLVCIVLAFRSRANMIVRVTLVTTLTYSTFLMSKHGSGSHYYIEPSIACVCAVSTVPWALSAADRAVRWALAAILSWVSVVTSIIGFSGENEISKNRGVVLAALREACPLANGNIIVSSDLTMELEIDGRVIVPLWQTTYLTRRGISRLTCGARIYAIRTCNASSMAKTCSNPCPRRSRASSK